MLDQLYVLLLEVESADSAGHLSHSQLTDVGSAGHSTGHRVTGD